MVISVVSRTVVVGNSRTDRTVVFLTKYSLHNKQARRFRLFSIVLKSLGLYLYTLIIGHTSAVCYV